MLPRGPDSPGYAAFKIVSGPLSLAEKRRLLDELVKQFPDDQEVMGYGESLGMQEMLEKQYRPVETDT